MKKTLQLILIVALLVIVCGFGVSLLSGTPGAGGGPTGNPATCNHSGNVNDSYQMLDEADAQYLTMHTYSVSCLDCGHEIVKPMRFEHSYFMGVCKCGFACDHPGTKADGLHCIQCDKAINISFTVQGRPYIVPEGATWADAHSKYGIFFSDTFGCIMLNGTCLTDKNGFLVLSTYKVIDGAEYTYCQHTKENNAGYAPKQDNTAMHMYFYNCGTCGKYVSKDMSCIFVGGVCKWCGRACAHAWDGEYCALCGLPCTHDYVDGVCTICHDGCDHRWSGGTCTVCKKVCNHPGEFTGTACEICGYTLITFVIDGKPWIVPQATTWADMTKYSQHFTIDSQDRVLFDGTVVIGPNGQPVGKHYTITPDESYMSCTHEASSVTYHATDNGAHTASYVCSVCGHRDHELTEHTYASSVCVNCGHECTHMVENGKCRWCDHQLVAFFVNDNYPYFVPVGSKWSYLTYQAEDFEMLAGVVYWRGYVLTDAEGYALKVEAEITDQGFYYTCQHKHTYIREYAYFNPTYHIEKHYCTVCGILVKEKVALHDWENGVCGHCQYACSHPLGEGLLDHCEQCGVNWHYFTVDGHRWFFVPGMTYGELQGWSDSFGGTFENADGVFMNFHGEPLLDAAGYQVKAGHEIESGIALFALHTYGDDGICTDCGAECPHGIHDRDEVCTTCGAHTYHGYDNIVDNVCKICGWVCPHDQFADGDCIYCGHKKDE